MKTPINRSSCVFLLTLLLAACSPAKATTLVRPAVQIENPYAAQPADGTLVRDNVQIVKSELDEQKSNPSQVTLRISFFTPTPCHQFRVSTDVSGDGKRINIEVYSLMQKDRVCALMRLNTPTIASLNLKGLSAGHYTVWVNGEKSLEFDM